MQKHGSMAMSRHPKHPSPTINSCTTAEYYIMLLNNNIVLVYGIRTKKYCFTVFNARIHNGV